MNNPVGSDVKTTFFKRGKNSVLCVLQTYDSLRSMCTHTLRQEYPAQPKLFFKGREIKSIECVRLCIGMIGKYLCIE